MKRFYEKFDATPTLQTQHITAFVAPQWENLSCLKFLQKYIHDTYYLNFAPTYTQSRLASNRLQSAKVLLFDLILVSS